MPVNTPISFELRPGEILGLTGRMGSGRTELALRFWNEPSGRGEIRAMESRSSLQ